VPTDGSTFPGVHLAQVNVARLRHPIDHPATADFVAGLAPVNAVADVSPGFVWRLQTDDGDATALRVFADPEVIVNLSVWSSLGALRDFVYRSAHTPFLRRRAEWFDRMVAPSVALWWVPAGHVPDVAEARDRLDFLTARGATSYAFGLRAPEPPLVFERAGLGSTAAAALIAELDEELTAMYPEPGSRFPALDADEVADGRGALLVGRLDGEAVACGALRLLPGEWPTPTAELQGLYVRPSARGRRIGAALVTELVAVARGHGVDRVVLETGVRQEAALALYRGMGFCDLPPWSDCTGSPLGVCLTRPVEAVLVPVEREPSARGLRTRP
jgi:ribosomal protein S18 acetylase RimI-like enzyme